MAPSSPAAAPTITAPLEFTKILRLANYTESQVLLKAEIHHNRIAQQEYGTRNAHSSNATPAQKNTGKCLISV